MRQRGLYRDDARRLTVLRIASPALAAFAAALAPCTPAVAADATPIDIGRSVVVVDQVRGQYGNTAPRQIKLNDDIIFEEDVSTGTQAKTVIEFRDGSTIELGPNAVVRIDSFIYNPRENTSHKTLSISSGQFRYLSGSLVRDQDTKIATPKGTLGVRG